MRTRWTIAVLLVCVVGALARAQSPLLTNIQVVELLGSGLSEDIVVAKIHSSDCDFDTSPAALKALKAANVPDPIILAMVQAPSRPKPVEPIIRNASVTCINAKEIPLYANAGDKDPIGMVRCGASVGVIQEGDFSARVRTDDGRTGSIGSMFLSKPGTTRVSVQATSTRSGSSVPNGMLRAVAWRAVPWVTTTYYQQQGSATTDCTGSGTWIGTTYQGNANCMTQYTPAQSIPVNWQHFTIYNLVETSNATMVIACTRNWAFSRCSHLVPGDSFQFEAKSGKVSVIGRRNGKGKDQSLDFDVVSSGPR